MRANGNFGSIQASNGGSGMLPAGGYVVRIAAVEDHTEEEKGWLGIVYDVYDPKTRSFPHHEDVLDPELSWRWTFRYYLTSDFGWSRYKALVEACERTEENKGFRYVDADGAEQTLVGKWAGFVIRHRQYVPRRGKSAGQEREQGYLYPHNFPNHWVPQQYLPDLLKGTVYYHYGDNKVEQAARHYWDAIKGGSDGNSGR